MTEKYEGVVDNEKYVISVIQDEDAEDPRSNDNIGNMICWHGRYSLGDKHSYENGTALLTSLACDSLTEEKKRELFDATFSWSLLGDDEQGYHIKSTREELEGEHFDTEEEAYEYVRSEVESWIEEEDFIEAFKTRDDLLSAIEENYVILPLYLYDHGGITMRTSSFSDPWDSGQVGWIYASKQEFRNEMGYSENELFSKDQQRFPVLGECVVLKGHEDKGLEGYGKIEKIEGNNIVVNYDYNKIISARKEENVVYATLNDVKSVRAEMAKTFLEGEVETYDQYLTGDIYYFTVEKYNNCNQCQSEEASIVNSCGGFYGSDPLKNGMLDHIGQEFKGILKQSV